MVQKAPERGAGAIVYPADGQIIAVDPDIPGEAQRVQFRAEAAPARAQWRLNGKVRGRSAVLAPWSPGRWRLALETAEGTTLDAVEFEVRGAERQRRSMTRTLSRARLANASPSH